MRKRIKFLLIIFVLSTSFVHAQPSVVIDPAKIAQDIIKYGSEAYQWAHELNKFDDQLHQAKEFYNQYKEISNCVKNASEVEKGIVLANNVAVYNVKTLDLVKDYGLRLNSAYYTVSNFENLFHDLTYVTGETADALSALKQVALGTSDDVGTFSSAERLGLIREQYNKMRTLMNLAIQIRRRSLSKIYNISSREQSRKGLENFFGGLYNKDLIVGSQK